MEVSQVHLIYVHYLYTQHTQLDVATAELEIYRERFTSGERQLEEAQGNLKETKASMKEKQT